MKFPTVHLNGSGAARLSADICAAYDTVTEAIEALAAAAPNARDYYPQGPSAFYDAQDEHASRLARLHSVRDELQTIAEHIARASR